MSLDGSMKFRTIILFMKWRYEIHAWGVQLFPNSNFMDNKCKPWCDFTRMKYVKTYIWNTHIYTYIFLGMYVYIYIYTHTYIYVCVCIYLHTCVFSVYIYICVCVCVSVCLCVCVYTWEELVSKETNEIWNHAAPFPFFLQQFHSALQFPVCSIPTTYMSRLSRKLQLLYWKI